MADDHIPQFAPGRLGRHARGVAAGSPVRAGAAAVAVLALAASAAYGVNMATSEVAAADGAQPVETAAPTPEASPSPEAPPQEPRVAWGPTVADWEYAQQVAAGLTVEQAAGQVIVANFDGREPSDVRSLITRHHLGGVIFFDGNVGKESSVQRLTEAALAAGDLDGRTWPVIVSVDQEGGPVARLTPLVPEMPAFMAAGAVADKQVVTDTYAAYGADIANLGFNLDYAPVADVTIGLADPVIRTRSAGSNPDNVAATVVAANAGFIQGGVIPTIKHFPGHGSVTTDSHAALPVQDAKVKDLVARDFVPFQAAIDAGAPVVMMGHIRVKEWGKGPSTLNPKAYSYLRETMGFEGVIVTDALNMAAVTKGNSPEKVAVAALEAGADVLLMPADVEAAHAGIVKAVNNGKLDRERLNDAAARSIALMLWQSSLESEVESGGAYVRDFSAAAATVVAKNCGRNYVSDGVRITGGWQSERDALAAALKKLGVRERSSGTHIHILGSPDGSAAADIVVAMDGPWGLEASNANVYVGLYGRGDATLAGLADVLTSNVPASANWPVGLDGIRSDACPFDEPVADAEDAS